MNKFPVLTGGEKGRRKVVVGKSKTGKIVSLLLHNRAQLAKQAHTTLAAELVAAPNTWLLSLDRQSPFQT